MFNLDFSLSYLIVQGRYILILGFENVKTFKFVYQIQVCLNWVKIEFTQELYFCLPLIQLQIFKKCFYGKILNFNLIFS